MKLTQWLVAAVLMITSTAFAAEWTEAEWIGADWTLVGRDRNEIVFIDRSSLSEVGDLRKARVLRSFSTVQTIGDTAFPHKSEILLYAVQCKDQSLGFEQWTLTDGEIGTGATVWSGRIAKPVLYKDPDNPVFAGMIASVCNG